MTKQKRRVEGVGLLLKFLFNDLETPSCVSPVKNLPWQFYAGGAALLLGSTAAREDPAQSA